MLTNDWICDDNQWHWLHWEYSLAFVQFVAIWIVVYWYKSVACHGVGGSTRPSRKLQCTPQRLPMLLPLKVLVSMEGIHDDIREQVPSSSARMMASSCGVMKFSNKNNPEMGCEEG